jgi:hypothetical protein
MTEPHKLPLWPDVLSVCAWLGVAMAGAYGLRAMHWRHPAALWVLVDLLGLVVGLAVISGVGSASEKLRARCSGPDHLRGSQACCPVMA